MALQFLHDNLGNTTGVFIPIEEWENLKSKYTDLKNVEGESEVPLWQQQLVNDRLAEYHKNPSNVSDFGSTIKDIRKNL